MVGNIIEYLKLHVMSLNQDIYKMNLEFDRDEILYKEGQIDACEHILSYIKELDKTLYEGVK